MFKFDFCLVFLLLPLGEARQFEFLPQFLKKGVINEAAHPGFKFKEKKKGSLNPNLHVPACRDFPPSSDGSKKCAGIWILISPLRERYERSSFQRTEENIFNPGLHYGTSYAHPRRRIIKRALPPTIVLAHMWLRSKYNGIFFPPRHLAGNGSGRADGPYRLPFSSFHAIRRPFAPLHL